MAPEMRVENGEEVTCSFYKLCITLSSLLLTFQNHDKYQLIWNSALLDHSEDAHRSECVVEI